MKGFVIYSPNQTACLSEFLEKADDCDYTPVAAVPTEVISLIGAFNFFNLTKAESILYRSVSHSDIANTLSHIQCWNRIAEDDEIQIHDFSIVSESDVTLLPNYYSALKKYSESYLATSPRDLVLLERTMSDEYWDNKIYSGEGEVSSVIFHDVEYYNNAYCKCYMIRKSLVVELLNKIRDNKPYWLYHHFGEFCQADKLSQISPLIAVPKNRRYPKQINVKTVDETLDFILENECSVIRFGDGEFFIIDGFSIAYQEYDSQLAGQLRHIVNTQSTKNKIICVPSIFHSLDDYNEFAASFWKGHLSTYRKLYNKFCVANWYGSTFISRPYIDWKDKSHSVRWFEKLKQIWQGKDILIVEGETSRSGVGNDLFAEANSIKRIICPSKNAYSKIEEIEKAILQHAEERLILLMLGPTAKVLAWNLSELGYCAIDIGHIDSEYEWFKMGATEKVKLNHKHTAEFNEDNDIVFVEDADYQQQIVCRIN